MDKDKILFFKCFERGSGFSCIIGVKIACGTLDIDYIQASVRTNSLKEVDSRNQASFKPE